MNKIKAYIRLLVSMLVCVYAVSACTGVEEFMPEGNGSVGYPVTLAAIQPYADTKISVNGTSVAWEQDDKIQLTAVAADNSTGTSELTWFSSIEGKDGHTASFSGFVSMSSAPQDCYFVYPVESSTVIDAATGKITLYYNSQSGQHEPFMYAKTAYDENGIYARLAHVGAVLEVDVQIDDVAYISFAGNRLETLSPVIVDAQTGAVSFTSQSNVQITVPVQKDGKTYIAVPPVNLEKGFSIICSNSDGSRSMIKTFSSDGGLGSGYDFTSKVGHIIPITLTGTLESYSVTSSLPVVEHTKNGGLLTGTAVRFTMNKVGVSDKLIEEWGATLVNSDGIVVRDLKLTNAEPMRGNEVVMNVANNWKLLPAGTYTFTPYYMIYGQRISMNSQNVTVSDPGIRLTLNGQTSYDKYKAGNVSGANSHTNTKIEGISVSTNVDLSLIDSYSASLSDENGNNADLGTPSVSSGTEVIASYGDRTRTKYQAYRFKASLKVGAITVSQERDFHITGLPYEADFTKGNPTGMSPAWGMISTKYSDSRVVYTGSSAVRSPGFYVPDSQLYVKTACDCGHNVTSNSRTATMSIAVCSSTEQTIRQGTSLAFGRDYYTAGWASGFKSKGYLNCPAKFALKASTPSLMYSLSLGSSFLGSNTFVSFRHKIEYSE